MRKRIERGRNYIISGDCEYSRYANRENVEHEMDAREKEERKRGK